MRRRHFEGGTWMTEWMEKDFRKQECDWLTERMTE